MATALATTAERPNLSGEFSSKYGIDQGKVFAILRETALKSKDPVTDAEVAAFMIVCNQYDLNPFIKEIYGFLSKGKMQYVVSVDGWATLINRQKELNGIEFEHEFDGKRIVSITCKIHHKNRAMPTVISEYFSECARDTDPWKQWPIRMLRHKAMIQCARIAFGLAGMMDEDEAERMSGHPPAILEGFSLPDDPEAKELMDQLGWAPATQTMARTNYKGRHDELMEYLNAQTAKAGEAKGRKAAKSEGKPAKKEAKPEPLSDKPFDATLIDFSGTESSDAKPKAEEW